jgi:hypothetical protein
MKRSSGTLLILFFVGIGLLLAWAAWLLATHDADGGRHPMGAAMLVLAVILGVLGILSLRRSRP